MRGCDADADGPLDTSEMPCVFEVGMGVWLEQRAGFYRERHGLDAHPVLWTLAAQAV